MSQKETVFQTIDLFGSLIEPLRGGEKKNKTNLGGILTIFMMFGILYSGYGQVQNMLSNSWDVYKYV